MQSCPGAQATLRAELAELKKNAAATETVLKSEIRNHADAISRLNEELEEAKKVRVRITARGKGRVRIQARV